MVPEDKLKEAFGPVIDILRNQGVDLTKDMVEVAPMAHFMLGGVRVDEAMRTRVPGLLASGELIYGMHGANRLSGNAITEALVTGRIAGETAAREKQGELDEAAVRQAFDREMKRLTQFWHPVPVDRDNASLQAFKRKLQQIMWKGAGPLRTESGLKEALTELRALRSELDGISLAKPGKFALSLFEKLEAANMLKVSEAIVLGALERKETRGAHVRLDYDDTLTQPSSYSYVLNEDGEWGVSEVQLPAGV
ncbi:hypothetical protein HMSSN139_58550 [Paenibacillus sp. HMSSN-139]|nr:hypothetical protein HMSSN139_58550 [Paenibacillus sp. HMSSN-139]